MRLYDMTYDEGQKPVYQRTLAEAHADAKDVVKWNPEVRTVIRITLRDYANDQQVFCDLFNGKKPPPRESLRQWYLTSRKGLRELPTVGAKPPVLEG